MKKYIPLSIAFLFGASSLIAADFTAIQSGDWTDVTVWEGGEVPEEDSSITYYNGITVDVTTAVTVADSPWKDHYATLNITGEDASLTYTGTFTMFGNTRMTFNVSDGATLDVAKFNWGTGGYSNFTITNGSTLNTTFDQFSGSVAGSTILVDNSSAITKGQWNLGANGGNYKINLVVTGANAELKGINDAKHTLRVNSQSTAEANVVFANGATATLYDLQIGSYFTGSGKSTVTIYGQGTKVTGQTVLVGKTGETIESVLQFGGFDSDNNFVAASAKTLENNWEVKVAENGRLKFLLGAENAFQADTLTNADSANAIFAGKYVKSFSAGVVEADFSNVKGLADGDYWFALLSSTQSIEGSNNMNNDVVWDWDSILNVIDTGDLTYNGYQIFNNTLFVNMSMVSVPEPSTYAAIFGALALAFAAYRRRK